MSKDQHNFIGLVIPTNVEALCISNSTDPTAKDNTAGKTWWFKPADTDFSGLPYHQGDESIYNKNNAYISENVLSDGFSGQQHLLSRGIHLHWALPDALTHAKLQHEQENSINSASTEKSVESATVSAKLKGGYPSVPNRWLVTRIITKNFKTKTPKAVLKSWVVISDAVSQEKPLPEKPLQNHTYSFTTFPVNLAKYNDYNYGKSFRYVGRVRDYERWTEDYQDNPSNYLDSPLTSIGYGSLTFASFYPNCASVFGFYDSVESLSSFKADQDALSYSVVGWYSDVSHDPLHNSSPSQTPEGHSIYKHLKWTFSSADTPTYSLYAGTVKNVAWDPKKDYATTESSAQGSPKIAIGNTSLEALAALLASNTSTSNLEPILEALQLGLLNEFDSESGKAKLQQACHQSHFTSIPAGKLFTVKEKTANQLEVVQKEKADKQTELPHLVESALPVEVVEDLHHLNQIQQQYDKLSERLCSLRQQIFADWYKYMVTEHSKNDDHLPEGQKEKINELTDFLKQEVKVVLSKQDVEKETAQITQGKKLYHARHGSYSHELKSIADSINSTLIDNFSGLDQKTFLQRVEALENKIIQLETLAKKIKQLHQALTDTLSDKYTLQTISAPRHWSGNDLCILLSGEDVKPAQRYGGDGSLREDGLLSCRLTTQLLSQLTIDSNIISNNDAVTLDSAQLLSSNQLSKNSSLPYVSAIAALIAESLLVDTNQAHLIATAFQSMGGERNPAKVGYDTLVNQIQQFQENCLKEKETSGFSWIGLAPSPIGVTDWKTPWLPLMLQWRVDYFPIYNIANSTEKRKPTDSKPADYSNNFDSILKEFEFSDNSTDLTERNTSTQLASQSYDNLTLLTPGAALGLQNQIRDYVKALPSTKAKAESSLKTLSEHPILSQALGGFNQALLMHKQTMQMPVRDSFNDSKYYRAFSDLSVRDAVGDQNRSAPQPLNDYNPIRAGYLKLNTLQVIDAFGRILNVNVDSPVVAQSLKPSDSKDYPIYLAPRLTQPSRLLFRWLSATNDEVEMNTHAHTSPICGWVIFNNLERGLTLYNAQGLALGSLFVTNEDRITWQDAPGNTSIHDTSVEESLRELIEASLKDENPHLKNFALGFAPDDKQNGENNQNRAKFLTTLLKSINNALHSILPQSHQDPSLAVLMSRPLALVRAGLKLDLQGLPAYNQSWNAFNQAVDSYKTYANWKNEHTNASYEDFKKTATSNSLLYDPQNPAKRSTSNFEKVKFPVMLGDLNNINDGFIGYFQSHTDNTTDYSTFYTLQPPEGENVSDQVVKIDPSTTLTIDSDPESAMTYLTMLIDPTAKIHATTGILPTKAIEIPPEHYSAALKNMAVSFLASPILSNTRQVSMPVPKEGQGEWRWIEKDKETNGWTNEKIAKATAQAKLSHTSQTLREGWLQFHQGPDNQSTSNNPDE